MIYDLAIGDRSYSSWSLRGWLLFEKFGIPVKCHTGVLYTPDFDRLLAEFAPARLVPAMRTPEGEVVGETLAIAETLAERHPEAGIWPEDPAARMMARYMSAEMHSGLTALRGDCPMNLLLSYEDSQPRGEVLADLARLEEIWARAHGRFGMGGPWLFGRYTAVDAFFAPVATRIATYNLPVSEAAAAYVAAHLADPSFRRWRAMGFAQNLVQASYAKPFALRPWPGPARLHAVAVEAGPSLNDACPYSGKEATHFLKLDDKTWGFCNAFCRDKTVADAAAWPKFVEMAGL